MADSQPSGTTAAATPIKDWRSEEGGRVNGEKEAGDVVKEIAADKGEVIAVLYGRRNVNAPRASHDASEPKRHKAEEDNGDPDTGIADHSSSSTLMAAITSHDPAHRTNDDDLGLGHETTPLHTTIPSAQSSTEPTQTHNLTHPPPPAPPKRFTSVNINKRFLEKTSSTLGTPLGGSPLNNHASGAVNPSGSGQRRGVSPNSRSPSTDRPASSRLVTTKLTAVPQPSTASTSGWLRNTPGNSTTPTPSPSSPQPSTNETGTVPPATTSLQQSLKRRPGESSAPNGAPASSGTASAQKQGIKPVWGNVPPPLPKGDLGRGPAGKEIQNDFPTAAEAAHGRKTKVLKAQLAAETAAAQTAAQKQAMIETAAAFRGAHLDANARHWDEMEDEDTDFLAGVIEFGDGTQYKIEHKAELTVPQGTLPPSDTKQSTTKETSQYQSPVTKEERFGEDIDRSWPRARTSPIHPTSSSLPPRPALSQHPSPTDGSASGSTHSPHDGTSPTSRVLFNERSNRLEPWSNIKPRLGPPPGPTMTRRDGREDHSPATLRPPSTTQFQGRDAPPHSQPTSGNVQLLQKGTLGSDTPWKGGLSRGFGHGPERGRWVDGSGSRGPLKDEEHSLEQHRRESISSSDAPGSFTRDRSRGHDGRWDASIIPHGRDIDHGRDRERRNSHVGRPPVLPSSLTRDRSRDAGSQHPPHPPQMSLPPVPPMRGTPGRDLPPYASHVRPATVSPSASVRSLVSYSSEQAQTIPSVPAVPALIDNGVDKDALVKDAMQLAIERAKKRKQEGEEEEKRRLEAAERARKKAEALAAAQERKKKAEVTSSSEKDEQLAKPSTQEAEKLSAGQKGVGVPEMSRERARDDMQTKPLPLKALGGRPVAPQVHPSITPSSLPRRPSIPPVPTPASQADSWRNKAAPVMPIPTPPSEQLAPPPSTQRPLPPPTRVPELDLSVQPDENIEVVDFSDLGKLMGASTLPDAPVLSTEHPPTLSRSRRPIASDYFDDRPIEPRESHPSFRSDQASWRRPLSMSTSAAVGEQLRTQTMPIFADDEQPLAHEGASSGEMKSPRSPTTVHQPFKRQSSHGDQASSSSTSQSAHMSPAMLALRSPRMSHFKEAPMSTLTDTMSRIKGALDGMQSQDLSTVALSKEANEKPLEHRAPATSPFANFKMNEMLTVSRREQREARPEISSPPVLPVPKEVFDVTRLAPPRSPKPAWNAFVVKLPKESRPRDAVSRKQLHFWNLPYPSVRWDILSWDPPVEGMNKRELSRDEIFHRKYAVKGGKLRVLLPNRRIVKSPVVETDLPSEPLNATSRHTLVTAAGVKIRLPSGTSSIRQNAAISSHPTSIDRPRDFSVPSWRRSATPLAPLKRDRQSTAFVNASSLEQLNTTSRSPPPEPSTPLPSFTNAKSSTPSRPSSAHSATVSLPSILASDTRPSLSKRPSGRDVAFFRTSRGDPEADSNKPLPRFTVNSELDSGEPIDLALVKHHTTARVSDESAQSGSNSLIRQSPRGPSETFLPHFVDSKSESRNSGDATPGARSVTPPPAHTSSAWGKSPLSFSVRSAPDPEHLKAVWSQATGRPAGSTSNSLKGIADDLPSIPFTVQDMKSEDGETPPPTAPATAPSRLSLQEVTRAFQQVPDAPSQNASSRPPSYAQTPLLSSGNTQNHRSNQPVAITVPPQHNVRPAFGPYSHTIVGHSPSPTMMYAPGVPSPVAHHRIAVSGPSPPIAHGMWLPTPPPPPSQPGSFMRPAGVPPPTQMMYPSPAPGTAPGVPGQMMHRRMSVVSPGSVPPPPAPSVYHGHPMDMQGHMHVRSPHIGHAHAVGHPVQHMHVGHMFSSPQSGQAPTMYAVPVGAGRGGMVPRPGYESYPSVPPHSGSYQSVPSTSFVFQS